MTRMCSIIYGPTLEEARNQLESAWEICQECSARLGPSLYPCKDEVNYTRQRNAITPSWSPVDCWTRPRCSPWESATKFSSVSESIIPVKFEIESSTGEDDQGYTLRNYLERQWLVMYMPLPEGTPHRTWHTQAVRATMTHERDESLIASLIQ